MVDVNAQRLKSLLDKLPQLVWTVTSEDRLVWGNTAWHELVGESEGESAGMALAGRLHHDDRQRRAAMWQWAKESGRPYEIEYRMRASAEAAWHWYLERGAVVDRGAGSPECWCVTATQIDEPRRREADVRQSLKRKDEFMAMLLHELRNPLAPIANGLQALLRWPDDPSAVNSARSIIERQLQLLTRLLDDLRDMSRIAYGNLDLHRDSVDLAGVVAAAIETARPVIEQNRHQLVVATPPTALVVVGDAMRLGQVVTNLLINAAKYTPPGGAITVVVESAAPSAVVSVRDNGIGIAPESLARIFDLFAQESPGSATGMGGLGIGLAVARQLVELHGGSIAAKSDGPGCGSEFVVRLPLPAP